MKKDIQFSPVEGVCIAISKYIESEIQQWKVFLINKNPNTIHNVFISTKGYGVNEKGESQETSVLRHFIPELHPNSYAFVEPIDPGVFHLNNEYWVSYFIGNQIYDKKYIFVPDSIVEENLTYIPVLETTGILHL